MSSWQAQLLNTLLRRAVKRRLEKLTVFDERAARAARRRLARIARWIPPPPPGVTVRPIAMDGVPGEWIAAPGVAPGRVLLYLHGGGFVIGSPAVYRDLTWRLSAATGAEVLAVDYRLAPEHPFPAALEDATAAWRWLGATGIDAGRIILAGDSAGAGLGLALLLSLARGHDRLPAAAVCLSPWSDLTMSGPSVVRNAAADPCLAPAVLAPVARCYLGPTDPAEPLASPLLGRLDRLPPLLIHAGSTEILLDDALRLADRARAAGVEVTLEIWDRMPHAFHLFARAIPEGRRAIRAVGEFARARFDPGPDGGRPAPPGNRDYL